MNPHPLLLRLGSLVVFTVAATAQPSFAQAQAPPSYTEDSQFRSDLEAKFNDSIGNTDPQHADWVHLIPEPSASAPANSLVVEYRTGQSLALFRNETPFAATWPAVNHASGVSWQVVSLFWDSVEFTCDPTPGVPAAPGDVLDFWAHILWHEWHHTIYADPEDFGYPTPPPIALPTPAPEDDCDHMKLNKADLDRACDEVCRLEAEEQYVGENSVFIAWFCRYINAKGGSYNDQDYVDDAVQCGIPVVSVNPPVFWGTCECCDLYSGGCLGFSNEFDFVDNDFTSEEE